MALLTHSKTHLQKFKWKINKMSQQQTFVFVFLHCIHDFKNIPSLPTVDGQLFLASLPLHLPLSSPAVSFHPWSHIPLLSFCKSPFYHQNGLHQSHILQAAPFQQQTNSLLSVSSVSAWLSDALCSLSPWHLCCLRFVEFVFISCYPCFKVCSTRVRICCYTLYSSNRQYCCIH